MTKKFLEEVATLHSMNNALEKVRGNEDVQPMRRRRRSIEDQHVPELLRDVSHFALLLGSGC